MAVLRQPYPSPPPLFQENYLRLFRGVSDGTIARSGNGALNVADVKFLITVLFQLLTILFEHSLLLLVVFVVNELALALSNKPANECYGDKYCNCDKNTHNYESFFYYNAFPLFFIVRITKILYLCSRKWQSGDRCHIDARESGESPELYLQL